LLTFWTLSMVRFYIEKNVYGTGLCFCPQVKILLSWVQSIELVPVSEHQNQHKAGYINQTTQSRIYKPDNINHQRELTQTF
jgi:hypothetical protein